MAKGGKDFMIHVGNIMRPLIQTDPLGFGVHPAEERRRKRHVIEKGKTG